MKTILSIIISGALVVSGFGQTRNVLVGTNNAVVQPTNFWSADASNARTGLGLGSAATNPASAFQPSSSVLTNLAANNGGSLTNLTASSVSGTLSLGQGGTGSTNAADARTALGLGTAATNPATAFQPSSTVLSNLASSNGSSITNIPVVGVVGALATNGNGAGLTNLTAANITGAVGLASNVTGTIAISNGGSGATTAGGARTNLGLGATNNVTFANVTTEQLIYGTNGIISLANQELYDAGGQSVLSWTASEFAFEAYISFNSDSNKAITRTNIGLGWSALTNTTASGFQTALFGTNTNPVLVNTNGEVVSPTNFWQVSPANTRVQISQPVVNATNPATNARNLYLYSLAISTTGVTNTITLPTNGGTLLGDVATVIHEGPTSSVTAVRQIGAGTNLITLNQLREAVKFIYEIGGWRLADNASYVEPIYFSGPNAAANAAASRTNLGLGATWLTNTNVTNFRTAIGLGAEDSPQFDDISSSSANISQISADAIGMNGAISWSGTNATANAATTRTNLGLGETNNVTFSALTLSSDLTLGSGDNIVLSTTTGTKIGTATNQLLGFYNQTPITRPSSTGVTTNGFTGNSGSTVHPQSTFTGGIGTNAYTISDIVAHLKSLGLIAP